MFYKLYQNCNLCPRNCGVNRTAGILGVCQADTRLKAGRAALHLWEEPCLSGKKGSGTVFFSHCNLNCIYCQNHLISQQNQGIYLTADQLSDTFLQLERQGAHNINLVTATHYLPHILDALEQAKNHGLSIPIVYNSSGYESVSSLKLLDGYIDIFLPDLKYFSSYISAQYSGTADYFDCAESAIEEMIRQTGPCLLDSDGILQKGVIIRHLMLPGLLSDTFSVIRHFARHWKNRAFFSLMSQYTPMGKFPDHPELEQTLNPKDYEEAIEYMSLCGITNGYLQSGKAASESFIPSFQGEGFIK